MSTPLAVLIVEDSEDDALLIADELCSGGYDPMAERVETCEELGVALLRPWDLIIADYRVPRCTGLDALHLVRQRDPDVPFFIVSGQISEEIAVEAMRAGAQDYVLKGNLARLAPAVDRELRDARIRRERREAQEALARSEQILQSVIDSSNAAIYLKDIDGRYLVLNNATANVLGTTKENALGKTIYDFLSAEVAESRQAHDLEVIEECAAYEHEETVDTAIGRRTYLSSRFPVYDTAGTIFGVGGISTDITERKRTEEALATEQARLRATVESLPDEVWLTDTQGNILLVSESVAEHLGAGGWSSIYEALEQLEAYDAHGNRRLPEEAPIPRSLRGEVLRAEPEMIRHLQTGELRHREVSSSPVIDREGGTIGAVAIVRDVTERRRTEEALEEERRRLAALESVSEAGLSTLDLRKLLDALVQQIALALHADASSVFVLDEEAEELVVYAAYNAPGLVGRRAKMGEGFVGEVLSRRESLCLPNAQDHPLFLDRYTTSARTLLGAPLIVRDRILGVVRVQSFKDRDFGPDEIRLLKAMADRAALAIENAELYEDLQRSRSEIEEALDRERQSSLLLQRALLPEAPAIGQGYEVAAEYVPAPYGGEIGGDFYDVFRIGDNKAGILIGDVSGKGLEAAAMAATTRSTIHAFVHETGSVSEALTKANSVLYSRQAEFEAFATVFLVVIDLATGEFTYSSAGHPPAMVCGCDGVSERLAIGGTPLAVLESQAFEEHHSRLRPGDSILMYTDGISEARRGSRLFEIEGIEGVARRCCDARAGELSRELLNDAAEWAEGKLRDDAAVVVVARKQ